MLDYLRAKKYANTQLVSKMDAINANHFFVDDTARDAYFVTNPAELVDGVFVSSNDVYQLYDGSAWVTKTPVSGVSKSNFDAVSTKVDDAVNNYASALLITVTGNPAVVPTSVSATGSNLTVTAKTVSAQEGTGDANPTNIRAISGVNSVVVSNTNGTDTDTYTVSPATPMYGIAGCEDTINLATGVLTRKTKYLVLDGVTTGQKLTNVSAVDTTHGFQNGFLVPGIKAATVNRICSHLKYITGSTYEDKLVASNQLGIMLSDTLLGVNPATDTTADVIAKFNAYFAAQVVAGTPVTVVFELTTATTETVTSHDITVLSGENSVSSDNGENVTVVYNKDTAVALDEKIEKSLLTTAGDVIYKNASGVPARLGIGDSGYVLKSLGGVPQWGGPARQGTRALKPSLSVGEIYICNDVPEVYMGTSTGELRFEQLAALKPAIVITYDDYSDTIVDYAYPIHQSEGVPATFFIAPSFIGGLSELSKGYPCSWAQIETLFNDASAGRIEIQNHTNEHIHVQSSTGRATVIADLEAGIALLKTHNIVCPHIAYPGGHFDYWGKEIVSNYFKSARAAGGTYNYHSLFDPYAVRCVGCDLVTDAYLQGIVDQTKLLGAISSIYLHAIHPDGVIGTNDDVCLTPARLTAFIQYAKAAGVRIIGYTQAVQELQCWGANVYNPWT